MSILYSQHEVSTMTLSSLKLVKRDLAAQNNAVIQRRNKVLLRLQEQRDSVAALLENKLYKPTQMAWILNKETGEETRQPVPKRFRKWYWSDLKGTYFFSIRYGVKILELKTGKNAVEAGKKEQLIPTIDALIEAVESGELDKQLEKAAYRKKVR